MSLSQYDVGLHDLRADLIHFADHSGFNDRRMFDQRALNFERTDAVAGAFNDIVPAAYEPSSSRRARSPVRYQSP